MEKIQQLTTWIIGSLMCVTTCSTMASIAIDRTRVIVTERDRSASAILKNTNASLPFLAQSWIEDATGKKITSPLLVSPPLQRINGGQKGIARVTKTAEIRQLPTDKETLFYLNIREIPPKSDQPNVLQLAMQSRIKLFYRPLAIIPKKNNLPWQREVTFKKQGGRWQIENPTPYYVTITRLDKEGTAENRGKLTDFAGVLIAPQSTQQIQVADGTVNNFTMTYVNDYGGSPRLRYHCQSNVCRALPMEQQPR